MRLLSRPVYGTYKGCTNLTTLPKLDEKSVLDALDDRYKDGSIYTFAGKVLVSLNPFEQTNESYVLTPGNARQYNIKKPHVYAIAKQAIDTILRSHESQVCVMTGESGSGKTEAAKLVIQYISLYFKQAKVHEKEKDLRIYSRLIQSNPLMEAFGNCATVNNSNSSRFLKWLQIYIDPIDRIITKIQVHRYLLEQRRVTNCHQDKFNFHIFHLLNNAAQKDQEFAALVGIPLNFSFDILKRSDGTQYNEHYGNSNSNWDTILEAIEQINIDQSIRNELFRVLSAILILGNVRFEETHQGDCSKIQNGAVATLACNLLGYQLDALESFLCNTPITVGHETILKANDPKKAKDRRDVLMMFLYYQTFDWLVKKINQSMTIHSSAPNQLERSVPIGILDVFGFENFANGNSLEQILINYCNEKLFLFFHHFAVKSEVELLENEGISGIELKQQLQLEYDTACLSMLELKQRGNTGILSMIDEETKTPRGNDTALLKKITKRFLGQNIALEQTHVKRAHMEFTVRHYAGSVPYNITGFVDKSQNRFTEDMLLFCEQSGNCFLSDTLFGPDDDEESEEEEEEENQNDFYDDLLFPVTPKKKSEDEKKKSPTTIGLQFKSELNQLMETMEKANPWFITCMKPNHAMVPGEYDPEYMQRQLRYTGIADICRVRKDSYAHHIGHDVFKQRFCLLHPQSAKKSIEQFLTHIEQLLFDLNHTFNWRIGKTVVFLDEMDMKVLEDALLEQSLRGVLLAQKTYRGFVYRKKYLQYLKHIKSIENSFSPIRDKKTIQEYHSLQQLRKSLVQHGPCGITNHSVYKSIVDNLKCIVDTQVACENKLLDGNSPVTKVALKEAIVNASTLERPIESLDQLFKEFLNAEELLKQSVASNDITTLQNAICAANDVPMDYQNPQLVEAQNKMNELLLIQEKKQKESAIIVQKFIRSMLARNTFTKLVALKNTRINAVVRLQCFTRRTIAIQHFSQLKQREVAAIRIQKTVRSDMEHKRFTDILSSVIKLQTFWRMQLSKRKLKAIKQKKVNELAVQMNNNMEHEKDSNIDDDPILMEGNSIEDIELKENSTLLDNVGVHATTAEKAIVPLTASVADKELQVSPDSVVEDTEVYSLDDCDMDEVLPLTHSAMQRPLLKSAQKRRRPTPTRIFSTTPSAPSVDTLSRKDSATTLENLSDDDSNMTDVDEPSIEKDQPIENNGIINISSTALATIGITADTKLSTAETASVHVQSDIRESVDVEDVSKGLVSGLVNVIETRRGSTESDGSALDSIFLNRESGNVQSLANEIERRCSNATAEDGNVSMDEILLEREISNLGRTNSKEETKSETNSCCTEVEEPIEMRKSAVASELVANRKQGVASEPVPSTKPEETSKPEATCELVPSTKREETSQPESTCEPVASRQPEETSQPEETCEPVPSTKREETSKPEEYAMGNALDEFMRDIFANNDETNDTFILNKEDREETDSIFTLSEDSDSSTEIVEVVEEIEFHCFPSDFSSIYSNSSSSTVSGNEIELAMSENEKLSNKIREVREEKRMQNKSSTIHIKSTEVTSVDDIDSWKNITIGDIVERSMVKPTYPLQKQEKTRDDNFGVASCGSGISFRKYATKKKIDRQLRLAIKKRSLAQLLEAIDYAKVMNHSSKRLAKAQIAVKEIENNHNRQLLREALINESFPEVDRVVKQCENLGFCNSLEFQFGREFVSSHLQAEKAKILG